ncbi:glutamate mutase L [Chloroflexota bacterium]
MAGMDDYQSIIAADFGSVNTRVVMIALVDGSYRMVARSVTRTTADDPHRDVEIGLYRALQILHEQTGRQLVTGKPPELLMPDRGTRGVDALVATASVGQPLRVVVVGLMPDVSVSSARYVLAGSYVEVVDTLSLADVRTEEQQINAILAKKPDLVFIVGGTDAGAEAPILELVRVVRRAVQIAPNPLIVLYAGNRAVQAEVNDMLDGVATLFMVDNIRPSLTEEALGPVQQGVALVYDHFKVTNRGGFGAISQLSAIGVLPTVQSFTNVARYLGEITPAGPDGSGGVLAVDVGSSTTTIAAAFRGRSYVNIRTDLGVGHSAAGSLAHTTPGNVRRWLTWDATADEISAYAYNKTLRPATVPQTEKELELEYALARETIRVAVTQARTQWPGNNKAMPALRPIIGAGGVLANAPHSGYAALLLLDAIQPVGVTELWLDPAGLIPALGAVGYLAPSAFVHMLAEGDLLKIGSVICADGQARRFGARGLRVTIKLSGGYRERKDVAAGTIWTYPLPPGQTAEVTIRAGRGFTIAGKSRLKVTLEGGTAGLIFDARGRPLPLPLDAEVRAHLYAAWIAGIQGVVDQLIDGTDETLLDQDLLRKVELMTGVEQVEQDDEQPTRRRGLFGWRRGGTSLDEDLEAALATPEESEETAQSGYMQDLTEQAGGMSDDIGLDDLGLDDEDEQSAPEQTAEADVPEKKGRRGLFGRRRAQPTVEEAETPSDEDADDAPPDEPDELDDMMAELRGATTEDSGRKRRGLRRR